MVKPLHAGLPRAMACWPRCSPRAGMTASASAIDGAPGLPARVRQRARRSVNRSCRPGLALGDSGHRHHRQAVPVVRRHASHARRRAWI
jgi:hypothetical protein